MGRSSARRRGDFELRLSPDERTILRELPDQLRNLIENEDPTSDPAMARLYPPAYEDDPIRNLEFERMAGDDLTSQRLSSINAMEGSIDAISSAKNSSCRGWAC